MRQKSTKSDAQTVTLLKSEISSIESRCAARLALENQPPTIIVSFLEARARDANGNVLEPQPVQCNSRRAVGGDRIYERCDGETLEQFEDRIVASQPALGPPSYIIMEPESEDG